MIIYFFFGVLFRIRETRKLGILESRFNKTQARAPSLKRPDKKVPRSRLEKTMENMGLDMSDKNDVTLWELFFVGLKFINNLKNSI